jgi:hypothetical protein
MIPRLHVIACRIFQREFEALAPAYPDVSLQYLEMGLHTGTPEELRAALQNAIHAAPDCQNLALAYGLCNRGLLGIRAERRPLVIPRAHDCLALLLGGTQRYRAELDAHPGTYFQSPGWIEQLPLDGTLHLQNLPAALGPALTPDELIARYGEDNAAYLIEQFADLHRHYHRLAYIATPVPQAPAGHVRAAQIARDRNWSFAEIPGDLIWLQHLLSGPWTDPDFLVVPPYHRVVIRYDDQLFAAEPESNP